MFCRGSDSAHCALLGGTQNEAETRVKSTAAMPTADDVGAGGMEGAKKALESVVDGMCPILKGTGSGGKKRRDRDDDSSDGDKRRRKKSPSKAATKAEAAILDHVLM